MSEKIETIITAKDQASSVFKNFGATVIGLNQGIELLSKAMSALAAPFAAVISEGKGFTKQMSAIRSITKITEADFKALSDEAERIGKTTSFSSTQAAKAMETLSRTGQTVEQVMQTTGQAMDFAAAQAISLDDAANTTAVQMNIFASDSLTAKDAVDTMNKGLGASAQNFGELQGALKTAALGASSLGISFEDLNVMVGTFANVGLKGEMAGTAIKIALKQLAAPTADAQAALAKYGITMDQINPATVQFKDIMQLMKEKQISFNDTIRIFGGEVGPNMTKVVAGGAAAFDEMSKKMDNAKTAAESAADQLNNLDGDLTLLDSGLSGLKLTIFKTMDTALRGIVQLMTSLIGVVEQFVSDHSGALTSAFGAIRAAVGYLLLGVGEILVAFGNFVKMDSVSAFLSTLGDVIGTVFEIVAKLAGKFIDLAKIILPPLLKELKPIYDMFLNLATKALSAVLDVLKWISSAIDKFTVKNMLDGFKDLKQWIDDAIQALTDFLRMLGLIPKESKAVAESVPIKELTSYGDYAERTANALGEVRDESKKTSTETKKTGTMMEYAAAMAKAYEDQLVVNPLNEAVKQLGDKSIVTGEETKKLARELINVTTAAKKAETAIAGPSGPSKTGGAKPQQDTGFFSGLWNQIKSGMGNLGSGSGSGSVGPQQALVSAMKSLGQTFANVGSRMFGALMDMVMGDEDIQEVIKEAMNVFQKIVKPIVSALMPIIKKLMGALEQIIKAVVPIITMIIEAISPVIDVLVSDILPVIIDLIRELGPVIKDILDIIVPILLELMPLIKAILELIIELLPILRAVLAIIKIFLPIIIAVIRIVTFLVNIITFLVKVLVALPEFIRDSLIAGLAVGLAPLIVAIKALEFVVNILKGAIDAISGILSTVLEPLQAIGSIIQSLIDAIGPLIDALSGAGGGVGGAIGGIGGAIGGAAKGIGSALGFAQGSTGLTRDQLVRLPGMEPDAGLIKAHVGETVGPDKGAGVTINLSVGTVDSTTRVEELRSTLEELFLSGRLRVS